MLASQNMLGAESVHGIVKDHVSADDFAAMLGVVGSLAGIELSKDKIRAAIAQLIARVGADPLMWMFTNSQDQTVPT